MAIRTLLLFSLNFFLALNLCAQKSVACNNEIFIRNDDKISNGKIPTLDRYQLFLKMDSFCYTYKIIKDSADFFFVSDELNRVKPTWLKKSDLIRIAIGYANGKLTFYERADTSSHKFQSIDPGKEHLIAQSVVVVNCSPGWYKIKLRLNNKTIIGWVKQEDLCSNPCTTCG